MSNQERDTHFQHSAGLLVEEIDANDLIPDNHAKLIIKERMADILAQFAYDFAYHLLMHTTPASGSTIKQFVGLGLDEMIPLIPDMTDWPEEGEIEEMGKLPKRYRC